MRRFAFDTVLVALNAADRHRLPFITTVLADAQRRGMGVIAMKVYAQGALLGPDALTSAEALGYVLSLPGVSHAIIGCSTPAEVDANAALVRGFAPLSPEQLRALELKTQAGHHQYAYFKR